MEKTTDNNIHNTILALTSFVVRYITINYHKHDIEAAESYYVSSINASIVLCILYNQF